jgi:hypothetical protein
MGQVWGAARNKNLEALEHLMAEDFLYSYGGSRSKIEAILNYRENPDVLEKLMETLEQGCKLTDRYAPVEHYVCPPEAADPDVVYFSYRAGFSKNADGEWIFRYFVAGD